HQRPGRSPWDTVRALWPTLGTGVIATCIAYLTFLFSGVDGLKQLSVFTITALLAAALATRYLLPALVDPATRDFADSQRLPRRQHHHRHRQQCQHQQQAARTRQVPGDGAGAGAVLAERSRPPDPGRPGRSGTR